MNDPIGIDEKNVIIEGHGRLLALRKLGSELAPVIRLSHLSPAQKKAYILAHNKTTMNTGFNLDQLKIEMESLREMEFDLSLTAFAPIEIANLQLEFTPNLPDENPSESSPTSFKVIVTAENEEQQQEIFNDLLARGYKVKAG